MPPTTVNATQVRFSDLAAKFGKGSQIAARITKSGVEVREHQGPSDAIKGTHQQAVAKSLLFAAVEKEYGFKTAANLLTNPGQSGIDLFSRDTVVDNELFANISHALRNKKPIPKQRAPRLPQKTVQDDTPPLPKDYGNIVYVPDSPMTLKPRQRANSESDIKPIKKPSIKDLQKQNAKLSSLKTRQTKLQQQVKKMNSQMDDLHQMSIDHRERQLQRKDELMQKRKALRMKQKKLASNPNGGVQYRSKVSKQRHLKAKIRMHNRNFSGLYIKKQKKTGVWKAMINQAKNDYIKGSPKLQQQWSKLSGQSKILRDVEREVKHAFMNHSKALVENDLTTHEIYNIAVDAMKTSFAKYA